jgi:glycosyltransferase involved in cell wall biosynthesis
MKSPLFTILTPCLNQADCIREAVDSVLRQGIASVEHIILDGGSSDGTLDILRGYSHLQVNSQADKGMYDALNRGLRMARGGIIGWLNADDIYANGAFKLVMEKVTANPHSLAIAGAADTRAGNFFNGEVVKTNAPVGDADFWQRMVDTPVTNAWFFRPEVFEQVGEFNADYRYVADREWFIRAALAGVHPLPVNAVLYHYRQHSGSATISAEDSRQEKRGLQRIRVLSEDLRMLESYLLQRELPPEARIAIRRSHSVRAYRLAATAAYHRQFQQAADSVRRGMRWDPRWLSVAARLAVSRLTRKVPADT